MTFLAAIASMMQQQHPAEPEKFLTLEQASEITGLTVTYLQKKIRAGELRSVRDGSSKVRRSDLARL